MGIGSSRGTLAQGDAGLLVVDVIINVAQIPDSKISSKLLEKNLLMLRHSERLQILVGKLLDRFNVFPKIAPSRF
jgi:hypothetical protein